MKGITNAVIVAGNLDGYAKLSENNTFSSGSTNTFNGAVVLGGTTSLNGATSVSSNASLSLNYSLSTSRDTTSKLAVTKGYVDNYFTRADGSVNFSNDIHGKATTSSSTDTTLVTKGYVDSATSSVSSMMPKAGGTFTGNVNFNSTAMFNAAASFAGGATFNGGTLSIVSPSTVSSAMTLNYTPSASTDAVNVSYVSSAISSAITQAVGSSPIKTVKVSTSEPSATVTWGNLAPNSNGEIGLHISGRDEITLTTSGAGASGGSGSEWYSHISIGHATQFTSNQTAGESSSKTVDFGGTFKVPRLTVNKYGHITAIADSTITLPSAPGALVYVGAESGRPSSAILWVDTAHDNILKAKSGSTWVTVMSVAK